MRYYRSGFKLFQSYEKFRWQDAQDPSFTFRIHSTAEDGAEMSEDLRWAVTPASISAILKKDSETKSDADNSKALNSELVPVCAMKIPFGLEISISLLFS